MADWTGMSFWFASRQRRGVPVDRFEDSLFLNYGIVVTCTCSKAQEGDRPTNSSHLAWRSASVRYSSRTSRTQVEFLTEKKGKDLTNLKFRILWVSRKL